MRPIHARAGFVVALAPLIALGGCNLTEGSRLGDSGLVDGSDATPASDAVLDTDLGALDATALEPGPLALVATRLEVLTDRLCDLDGDDVPDNSVADLGEPAAEILASALDSVLASSAGQGTKIALHFRMVDEPARPSASDPTVAVYLAAQPEVPPPWWGETTFYAERDTIDTCGEPLFFLDAELRDGVIGVEDGRLGVPMVAGSMVVVEDSRVAGTVAPGGARFELTICGFVSIGELGAVPGFIDPDAHTLLEDVLLGGRIAGIPSLPGLEPDIDVDGDGLERVVVDEETQRVASCVDGDSTTIEGADCWDDERIADGFSVSFRMSGARGRYAGPEPGWEYRLPRCDVYPPETTFFAFEPPSARPCAAEAEPCDPRAAVPCCDDGLRCSGANRAAYLCLPLCEPTLCPYGEEDLGLCLTGAGGGTGTCLPYMAHREPSDCNPGDSGCETEHGVSEGTVCEPSGASAYCVATCEGGPTGCSEGHRQCHPLVREEGGVCIPDDEA